MAPEHPQSQSPVAPAPPRPPSPGRPTGPIPGGPTHYSPLTFDDLAADLIWPRILRAAPLAGRPSRVLLGAMVVLLAGMFIGLGRWVDRRAHPAESPERAALADPERAFMPGEFVLPGRPGPAASASGAMRLADRALGPGPLGGPAPAGSAAGPTAAPRRVGAWLPATYVQAPARAALAHPLALLVSAPWALLAAAIGGGAISRMAAREAAGGAGAGVSLRDGLGFALSRTASLAGAVLMPLVLIWLIALIMAAGGWVFLKWPVVTVLGGLLFGPALLLALVATVLMAAFTLGWTLLIPAVACDGSDAIDAVQRAYAYTFARPGRLVLYTAIAAAQGALAVGVVAALAWGAATLALGSTGAWLDLTTLMKLWHGLDTSPFADPAAAEVGSYRWSGALIRLWLALAGLTVAGYAVSYLFCSSTLVYLSMRRLCDGQDHTEIWTAEQEPRLPELGTGSDDEEEDA